MLNFKGTVTLETKRLVLGRFTMDDAESVYRNWASDEEVCKYMRWHAHRDLEETKRAVAAWLDAYKRDTFCQWAITLKGGREPVGAICLSVVNENDCCADTAYCIGRKYWGQGIVSEALKAVVAYAFGQVGYNRVEAYHSVNNPASGKVMQHAGMAFEGIARQKFKSAAGFQDGAMYAILKEDYEKQHV